VLDDTFRTDGLLPSEPSFQIGTGDTATSIGGVTKGGEACDLVEDPEDKRFFLVVTGRGKEAALIPGIDRDDSCGGESGKCSRSCGNIVISCEGVDRATPVMVGCSISELAL
jgi:hypothetical protein